MLSQGGVQGIFSLSLSMNLSQRHESWRGSWYHVSRHLLGRGKWDEGRIRSMKRRCQDEGRGGCGSKWHPSSIFWKEGRVSWLSKKVSWPNPSLWPANRWVGHLASLNNLLIENWAEFPFKIGHPRTYKSPDQYIKHIKPTSITHWLHTYTTRNM